MGYLYYNTVDHGSQSQYPDWKDKSPNLKTFLDAFNLSQPIIQSQFELVMSRWPRTIFFAKNVTIPGVSANTVDINHAGFTIPIATHAKYETTEISISIIADKEGCHYYDLRNMVLQSGHPLVAGDTTADIGETEDTLEIKLRNKPGDKAYHHWTIHNWRPIKIGDVELMHDSTNFVEFELTGTFTHISYDSGVELQQPEENSFSVPSEDGNSIQTKNDNKEQNDNPSSEHTNEPANPKKDLNFNDADKEFENEYDIDRQDFIDKAAKSINNGPDAEKRWRQNTYDNLTSAIPGNDADAYLDKIMNQARQQAAGQKEERSNLPLRFSMTRKTTSENAISNHYKQQAIKTRTIDPNHKTRNIF